jgi:hypothetical protein
MKKNKPFKLSREEWADIYWSLESKICFLRKEDADKEWIKQWIELQKKIERTQMR